MSTRVAILKGARTPFVKANTAFKKYSALQLAVHSVEGLLKRSDVDPSLIDEVAYGVVIHNPNVSQLAREIVLSSSLSNHIPAHTVSNNCISGIQAISNIHDAIMTDRIEVGLAGGTESMSNPPVLFNSRAARTFIDLATQRSWSGRLRELFRLRPWDFKPTVPAIAEPSTGLSMGEHCELMAKEWKISRESQDEIAYNSHQNAHQATEDGRLIAEIVALDGVDRDLLVRPDTSLERLAKLRPVFDPSSAGTLTAGNSSALTDGASSVLLASESAAKDHGWEPLAFIKAFEYAAVSPAEGLLMAPGVAVPRVLAKAGLTLDDIGLVEMHEAFGAQVLCNLEAWEQGWKEQAIGRVDRGKLNVLGSSIAVGHPFSATGGRIVTTLANEMKRRKVKYGLISICAAGALAAAMILERPE